jgi:adenylate kinase
VSVAVLPPRPWPSILLIGPTGSGKTPLGAEIEKRGWGGRRCVHFDFGAALRAIGAGPAVAEGLTETETAAVRASLATGALFEDRDLPMIRRIVERFAEGTALGPADLIVLNGLPRHPGQAEGLSGLLAVERIVLLEADAEVIGARLRLDPGGDRAGRVDDTSEAVERRLADYRARTLPLLDHYRDRGVPVTAIRVTAAMTAAHMLRELEAVIGGKGGRA